MFVVGNTYSPIVMATEYAEDLYDNMVAEAKAELTDLGRRYELFAKAEAHLIQEAFVIPYAVGGGGFVASKLDPFMSPYAPFGISNLKFKFQVVRETPMTTDEYYEAFKQWENDRAEALERAGQ